MFFTLVSHMPVIIHHVQLQSHFDRETQLVVAQVCVKQFADLREAVFYGIVVNEERGARVFKFQPHFVSVSRVGSSDVWYFAS